MATAPGLAPQNLRQLPEPASEPQGDIMIDIAEDGEAPVIDDHGNVIQINHDDGSITISLDGSPLISANDDKPADWFDNLVGRIEAAELSRISDDLLRGIDADLESRKDWIETRAQGIKLLGLKIEIPGLQGASDGAPVEGMSKVRHPLLLEAVLRFQANARGEMLPTDGPVKIRNDDNNSTPQEDGLANALEKDLNHYLTSTASEYYPDTDRMFLMLGFGGTTFKKVYFCPLRNRPVSESVDAPDLIVNNEATDLANAKRVTHRIMMRPSTVKRMQILGVYRDVDLPLPNAKKLDSLDREKDDQQGIRADAMRPEDRDREMYECYCELDIKGFEHRVKGKVTGLEIPYRVTIDLTSREILSIVRNYDEKTADLPVARQRFVKYTFVPGLGFYDIGLLHILGNTTNALTAAWREMLDNGMFANFPGFLMADTGGRQNTNIFRVPPGGGALVKTGGMNISQAIMPLPYNTAHMPALQALTDEIAQTGQRIGGTSEMMVGEGRPDAPVGTTLAAIEQAAKVLNAVHKRMHSSQAEEFRLICECFQENPESFWQRNFKPTIPWDQDTFLQALANYDLVPQADPNTASHAQRAMKVMGLVQLAQAAPQFYDLIAVNQTALRTMGWGNPSQFMSPPSSWNAPSPDQLKDQAASQASGLKAQADMIEAQARASDAQTAQAELQAKIQSGFFQPKGLAGAEQQPPTPVDPNQMAELQVRLQEMRLQHADAVIEADNRKRDRESKERIAALQYGEEMAEALPEGRKIADSIVPKSLITDLEQKEPPLNPADAGPMGQP